MYLTSLEKDILLKTVHCSHFLKSCRGSFFLKFNQDDGCWYGFNTKFPEDYFIRSTLNENTFLPNPKFELCSKPCQGVVTKIEEINLTTLLGLYENSNRLENTYYYPAKYDGQKIPVAHVYYQNGKKHIVPLSCIEEYQFFDNGASLTLMFQNLQRYLNQELYQNKITFTESKVVYIQNTRLLLSKDCLSIEPSIRMLRLDISNFTSLCESKANDQWFPISDEDYNRILNFMASVITEKYGFTPKDSYGQTNYDRLVNFCNYPFAPVLNSFSYFFNQEFNNFETEKVLAMLSGNEKPTVNIQQMEYDLKRNPDCVHQFIELCGIKYNTFSNRLIRQGHRYFLQFLGLSTLGFTDEAVINSFLDNGSYESSLENNSLYFDKAPALFLESYMQNCYFVFDYEKNCMKIDTQVLNQTYDALSFLMQIYDQKKAASLIYEVLIPTHVIQKDALLLMKTLWQDNHLDDRIIRKIGREGFTLYNHNMLMEIRNENYNLQKFTKQNINEIINYEDAEQQLEWEDCGYKFCLPEDTDRLLEIGSHMNICVGTLYREPAVNKETTIVYAKKNDSYELCIEVKKHKDGFHLIQKSGFSNNPPKGLILEVFNRWCRTKNIKKNV